MKRSERVAAVWTVAVLAGCASGPLGARPVVSLPSEGGEGRDNITISFQVSDEDLTAVSVAIEYDDGSGWKPATLRGASPGVAIGNAVTGLRPTKACVPVACSVTWDSWADGVGAGGSTNVTIRLTPSDIDGQGAPVLIPSVTVNNRYPVLYIAPPAVTFVTGVTGLTNPADLSLDVTNLGPAGTQMNWTITEAVTWLAVTPGSGLALDSMVSAGVTLSAECASNDLTPDTYTAMITVAGEDLSSNVARDSPQDVPVTFTVREQRPEILIHNGDGTTPLTDLPVFTCVQGQADPVATPSFWVKNSSAEPASLLSWTATDDLASGSWLVYAPASSADGSGALAAGASEQVTVSISGGAALPAGHYYPTITVTGGGVDGHTLTDEARTVGVHLWVKVPPVMQLSSNSVSFSGSYEGISDPVPNVQSVTLTNPGEVDLGWSADWVGAAPGWLSVEINATPVLLPTGVETVLAGGIDSDTITLTADSLTPVVLAGDYSATIRLTDQYGVTRDLDVSLHVGARATIERSPASLTFDAAAGGVNPSAQTLWIWNSGEATLNWTADITYTSGSGWLKLNGLDSVSDTCTTETDAVSVSVIAGALAAGTYDATINITDAAATNSPRTVSVRLYLADPSYVVINELDPDTPDWLEIYNPWSVSVDLTGWEIRTGPGASVDNTYVIPSFTLPAYGYVTIHEYGSAASNTATDLYTVVNINWLQSGGFCMLVDDTGQGVDFVRWGNATATPPIGTSWFSPDPPGPIPGNTLGRDRLSTDTDWGTDWENTCGIDAFVPTPGAVND